MSARMPVVFVSHGAPDALLKSRGAVDAWREIGRKLPPPQAILVVSAHWQARTAQLSLAGAPTTMHDFQGFAPELYRLHYPAPGAPALAERAAALLSAAGHAVGQHPNRGLDHGAWIPLTAMFPQANLPVTQLSLTRADAAAHCALGRALSPLRDEGVLILASGAITHNFAWLDFAASDSVPPQPQAKRFADWVGERLAARDVAAILEYRATPDGAASHPSEEHFLPLLLALGAANAVENSAPQRYAPDFAYRGLAMDAYVWSA